MSDKAKQHLAIIGICVAIASGVTGLLGAFVILPYRMSAAEEEIKQVKTAIHLDHDTVTRIDSRTALMADDLKELKSMVRK